MAIGLLSGVSKLLAAVILVKKRKHIKFINTHLNDPSDIALRLKRHTLVKVRRRISKVHRELAVNLLVSVIHDDFDLEDSFLIGGRNSSCELQLSITRRCGHPRNPYPTIFGDVRNIGGIRRAGVYRNRLLSATRSGEKSRGLIDLLLIKIIGKAFT